MKIRHLTIAISLVATALMAGCANTNSSPSAFSGASQGGEGVIEAIDTNREGGGIGAGTVIGGIVGGVIGHQVGGGRGNDVATVAGAVGGAVVGHEIEKGNRSDSGYRIQVRLNNGDRVTVIQDSTYGMRVGDRVRVENDRVYNYNENYRERR